MNTTSPAGGWWVRGAQSQNKVWFALLIAQKWLAGDVIVGQLAKDEEVSRGNLCDNDSKIRVGVEGVYNKTNVMQGTRR